MSSFIGPEKDLHLFMFYVSLVRHSNVILWH